MENFLQKLDSEEASGKQKALAKVDKLRIEYNLKKGESLRK